jgi:hypothetical protein
VAGSLALPVHVVAHSLRECPPLERTEASAKVPGLFLLIIDCPYCCVLGRHRTDRALTGACYHSLEVMLLGYAEQRLAVIARFEVPSTLLAIADEIVE